MICTKCHIEKSVSEFHKDKAKKTGFRSRCKKCVYVSQLKYKRTKTGLIKHIYNGQKGSCKTRGHNPPGYDVDWLIKFILDHKKFNKLYKNWVGSGFQTDLSPSIDRIDDSIGYTEDNIRLTIWRKNYMKQKKIERIPINQFTLSGKYIQSFKSALHASRELKIDNLNGGIGQCLSGKCNQAKGFQWRKKSEGKANIQAYKKNGVPIDYFFGGVFYDTFPSTRSLAEHIGISHTTISRVIREKTFKHHEHEFKTIGYYEKQNGIK